MRHFDLDKNTAFALGFSDAGWQALQQKLSSEGRRVYTTIDDSPMAKESFYWKHHDNATLREKMLCGQKEPKSVEAALSTLAGIFMKIESEKTRINLFSYFANDVLLFDKAQLLLLLNELSAQVGDAASKNQWVLEKFCDLCEVGFTNSEDVNLSGYGLACLFRTTNILRVCLSEQDVQLFDDLTFWSNQADLQQSNFDTQYGLAQSKALIADALQFNLQRLSNNEPIIPLYFVVSSDVGKASTVFTPSWFKAVEKLGKFYTLAEMRMIYKLMNEVDDALIVSVMKEMIFFMARTQSGFITIPAPWDDLRTKETWENRKRTKDKLPYKNRSVEAIPEWIAEMCALSHSVSESLTYKRL